MYLVAVRGASSCRLSMTLMVLAAMFRAEFPDVALSAMIPLHPTLTICVADSATSGNRIVENGYSSVCLRLVV